MNGAQIHLLVNHLPVLGVAFSAALTLAGILRGSDEIKKVGLWAFVASGLMVLPAFFTGEGAEEVLTKLPEISRPLIHAHEEAAEFALAMTLLLGAGSLAALIYEWKKKILSKRAVQILFAISLLVFATLAKTAHDGGLIRHTELH